MRISKIENNKNYSLKPQQATQQSTTKFKTTNSTSISNIPASAYGLSFGNNLAKPIIELSDEMQRIFTGLTFSKRGGYAISSPIKSKETAEGLIEKYYSIIHADAVEATKQADVFKIENYYEALLANQKTYPFDYGMVINDNGKSRLRYVFVNIDSDIEYSLIKPIYTKDDEKLPQINPALHAALKHTFDSGDSRALDRVVTTIGNKKYLVRAIFGTPKSLYLTGRRLIEPKIPTSK